MGFIYCFNFLLVSDWWVGQGLVFFGKGAYFLLVCFFGCVLSLVDTFVRDCKYPVINIFFWGYGSLRFFLEFPTWAGVDWFFFY